MISHEAPRARPPSSSPQLGPPNSTFVYPTAANEAADTAEAIAHGKNVPKKQSPPTIQVTKQNAASLYKRFDMSGKVGG